MEAKRLFEQGLADNPNIDPCKSNAAEVEVEIPESYDWRQEYPDRPRTSGDPTQLLCHLYLPNVVGD